MGSCLDGGVGVRLRGAESGLRGAMMMAMAVFVLVVVLVMMWL